MATAFAAQAATLSGPAAVSAQGAALALQAGVQADAVPFTASLLAGPSPGANSEAAGRSSELGSSGSGFAFAFQLTVLNSPQGPSTQVFSGVVLYEDAADAALAAGVSPGSAIPPAVGLILVGGTAVWEATAGQVSAHLDQTLVVCPVATLPAYITACNLATFTSAGFAITASTPFGGAATGSKQTSVANASMVGATLTVDCSQSTATSLCAKLTSVSVSVSPSAATVQTGATQQFAATVTGTSNSAITWSVQPGGAGGTVSSTGLYTAPASVGTGTDHVLATSVADPLESGTATVTVSATPVIGVTVSPLSVTVQTDATQQFAATVTGTSNMAVTWSVEVGGAGGTVNSSGLYTAPPYPGTDHVVATSVADASASGAGTVTVSNSGPTITVSIQPYAVTVAPGGVQQFEASVMGTSNTAVTWSVRGAPASGTISSTGLYTAPMAGGTYFVVATSVADTNASGSAEVTVPSSGFAGNWYGPYSITEGSTLLSGSQLEVVIVPGAAGSDALSVVLLCVAPNFVPVTMTSSSTFTIESPFSCPLADQNQCATATLTFTSLYGTLSADQLSVSFAGTIAGLSGTSCTTVTDFSGTFGPAINE